MTYNQVNSRKYLNMKTKTNKQKESTKEKGGCGRGLGSTWLTHPESNQILISGS